MAGGFVGGGMGKRAEQYEGRITGHFIVACLIGSFGGSLFGYDLGVFGPFNFQAGGKQDSLPQLHLNPYSWSKVSNMIYLDSPAGVGLSYSTNKHDYETGDLRTASDTHKFLLKEVFDRDRSNANDPMVVAEFSISSFVEAVKMKTKNLPDGTIIDNVMPCRKNCLVEESAIYCLKGRSCKMWSLGRGMWNMAKSNYSRNGLTFQVINVCILLKGL